MPGAMTADVSIYAKWLVGSQVTYNVNYYLEKTTTKLTPSALRLGTAETTVSEQPVFIYGYVPLTRNAQTAYLTYEGPNDINIYYRKVMDVPYAIRYFDRGHFEAGATGASMVVAATETGVNPGGDYSVITHYNSKVVAGYTRHNLTDVVYFDGDPYTNAAGQPYQMTFLYDPVIYYQAAAGGTVTSDRETLISTADSAIGAKAVPGAGYLFLNWTDAAGAVVSTAATLRPTETQTGGDAGFFGTATFTANFVRDNVPPTLDAISNRTAIEKMAMAPVPVSAWDNSGEAPAISLAGQPAGIEYNAATKRIEGTPTVSDWSATEESRHLSIAVTATDGAGNTATTSFILTVYRDTDGDTTPDTIDTDDDNDGIPDSQDLEPKVPDTAAPVITTPEDRALLEHAAMTAIAVTVTDNNYVADPPAGVYPTVTVTGLPIGVSYNPATRQIEGTPRVNDWVDNPDISYENWRDFTVTITAVDTAGNTSNQNFVLTVNRDTDKDGIADQSKDGTINDPDDDNDYIEDARDSNDKVPDTVAPVISAVTDVTYIENIAITQQPSANNGKQIEVKDESGYMPDEVTLTGLPAGLTFTYVRNPVQHANDPQYMVGTAHGTGSTEEGAIVWGTLEESRAFTATVTAKDAARNASTLQFTITILRDTDGDGLPDTTDPDDDNDGIPDLKDTNPKAFDPLAVTLSPDTQLVVEGKPIAAIAIAENKSAAQALSYSPMGAGGLLVTQSTNVISGTLVGLKWSNSSGDANYETQNVLVTVTSTAGTEKVVSEAKITVQRDTDKDGIPDIDDPDDDNDGVPDEQDPEPKGADVTAPVAPVLDPVCVNATEVTGTGEPFATVTVTFPDGKTSTAVVDASGHWAAPLPDGLTPLEVGQTITAKQTDRSGNTGPSASTEVTTMAVLYTPLAAAETVERGNPYDTYNLKDNIINLSELPEGTTVTDATGGNVVLNTVGSYTGKVTVTYPDGSFEVADVAVTVVDTIKPAAPEVNQITALDRTISGTGEPGATVTVIFRTAAPSLPCRLMKTASGRLPCPRGSR